MQEHSRIAPMVAALLLAGCAWVPPRSAGTITLHYAQSDYRVYAIDAKAEGRYEVRDLGKLTYQARRLVLDKGKLAALAQLAERQNFYALPADLDKWPAPPADDQDCDPDLAEDPGCERLDFITVTSDCGPDSHLHIANGNRSNEIRWSCDRETSAAIKPLLDAIEALFAEYPQVANAPAPRRWRR
ncbi:MAG: hypothetical protein JNN30_14385 [Rhodanobacteraceae bacterium]|nr:hypothetical protein [Rhodanobacteraceae bacterium]